MTFKSLAFLAVSSLAIAAPASAATLVTTGSTAVNGTYGTSTTFSAGTGVNQVQVRASAWHADKVLNAYTVSTAFLGMYSSGLGATGLNDSNGNNNLHTTDNQLGTDFILLQFDRNVKLTGADLTAFQIGTSTDNDASISAGITGLAWTSKIDLTTQTALTTALLNNAASFKNDAGTPATRSFASYGQTGNVWLIAADLKNLDGIDGFKLTNIVAAAAVPEPATWAMMIGGFGLVGGAMRRRTRKTVLA